RRTSGCVPSSVPRRMPRRYRRVAGASGAWNRRPRADGSSGSAPAVAASTTPQSSAVWARGPSLSIVALSVIAPWRLTRPNVGRRPVTPQNAAGYWIDPQVSDPSVNGSSPAATAAAEPLEDPPDQRDGSQGDRPDEPAARGRRSPSRVRSAIA